MLKSATILTATLALGTAVAPAQTPKAPLSPPAHSSLTIAGATITVDYSAPSMRGRQIFGSLVPWGQVWRTGANKATTLKTEAALNINGLRVPKGEYTIYTIPEPDQWTLIINKQTGQWGTVYDPGQDLGRVKMTVSKPPEPIQTFTITVAKANGTENKGFLVMQWENEVATAPFTVLK